MTETASFPTTEFSRNLSAQPEKGNSGIEIVIPEDLPHTRTISKITVEQRSETVYNFSVEGDHTYFVSEDGERWVLVHNEDYGGEKGINRWKSDSHQKDYDSANAKEDTLRKNGNLTQ